MSRIVGNQDGAVPDHQGPRLGSEIRRRARTGSLSLLDGEPQKGNGVPLDTKHLSMGLSWSPSWLELGPQTPCPSRSGPGTGASHRRSTPLQAPGSRRCNRFWLPDFRGCDWDGHSSSTQPGGLPRYNTTRPARHCLPCRLGAECVQMSTIPDTRRPPTYLPSHQPTSDTPTQTREPKPKASNPFRTRVTDLSHPIVCTIGTDYYYYPPTKQAQPARLISPPRA